MAPSGLYARLCHAFLVSCFMVIQCDRATATASASICVMPQLSFNFFNPLGKLAGRAIYFTDVFSLFFLFFLMVDYLANVAETLIEQSSPKFQDS